MTGSREPLGLARLKADIAFATPGAVAPRAMNTGFSLTRALRCAPEAVLTFAAPAAAAVSRTRDSSDLFSKLDQPACDRRGARYVCGRIHRRVGVPGRPFLRIQVGCYERPVAPAPSRPAAPVTARTCRRFATTDLEPRDQSRGLARRSALASLCRPRGARVSHADLVQSRFRVGTSMS
jgi:hypothetical protein